MALPGKCAIPGCAKPRIDRKLVRVTHKGYASLLKASQRRGDNIFNLPDILAEVLFVHEKCRRVYTSETSIIAAMSEKKSMRGSLAMYKTCTTFWFGYLCLLFVISYM